MLLISRENCTRTRTASKREHLDCLYVCVFMVLITTLVLCARSQDLVISVSERRVHVVLSTAGFKGGGKPCHKTHETRRHMLRRRHKTHAAERHPEDLTYLGGFKPKPSSGAYNYSGLVRQVSGLCNVSVSAKRTCRSHHPW